MTNLGVTFFPRGVSGPRPLLELAKELEAEGFDHFFVVEGGNDSMTVLAGLALATSRAQIGSGIANIYIRHPYEMGLAASAVEALSGGRLILGLGTAHQVTNEQGLGLRMDKPLSRMRDFVTAVRAVLDSGGQRIEVRTERYQITGPANAWAPRRRVPIILAALGYGSVRLAAQVADGVILSLATLEQIRTIRRILNEEAAAAGRDGAALRIYPIVNTVLRPTQEEALPLLRAAVAGYARLPFYQRELRENGVSIVDGTIRDEDVLRLGIAGPPEAARERIAAYREAGADVVLLSPGGAERDPVAAYRGYLALAGA
ncbi:MAG: LLM class flavin-dependent oxidoreductase [Chloroflexota bacterium]|nr:LLM class flavin-dependent oxidoreductase [Dehalococcoidia bacterium]MDW8253478.1 LLM class flavin-dependent oxidoreductase [Chloroflexota bacterium]